MQINGFYQETANISAAYSQPNLEPRENSENTQEVQTTEENYTEVDSYEHRGAFVDTYA